MSFSGKGEKVEESIQQEVGRAVSLIKTCVRKELFDSVVPF